MGEQRTRPLCGAGVAHYREGRTGQMLAVRLYCRRLECRCCGPRWRRAVTRHLGELIQGHPRLYLLACPAGAWGTLRDGLGRQLRRTEAANPPLAVPHGWAAWRDGSGVTVISSRPHRLRGGRSTVEILAPDDALALVRSLMEALTHKSQLSTSHSWKLGRASRMIA